MKAIPYIESGMGNAVPCEGCELHGVLHKLSEDDFKKLFESEGEDTTYILKTVVAKTYDNREIEAKIFTKLDGNHPVPPSRRYMNLLIDGAKHYKLKTEYIKFLENYPVCNAGVLPKSFIIGFVIPVALIGLIGLLFTNLRIMPRSVLKGVYWLLVGYAWFVHDYMLRHLFGSCEYDVRDKMFFPSKK